MESDDSKQHITSNVMKAEDHDYREVADLYYNQKPDLNQTDQNLVPKKQ